MLIRARDPCSRQISLVVPRRNLTSGVLCCTGHLTFAQTVNIWRPYGFCLTMSSYLISLSISHLFLSISVPLSLSSFYSSSLSLNHRIILHLLFQSKRFSHQSVFLFLRWWMISSAFVPESTRCGFEPLVSGWLKPWVKSHQWPLSDASKLHSSCSVGRQGFSRYLTAALNTAAV